MSFSIACVFKCSMVPASPYGVRPGVASLLSPAPAWCLEVLLPVHAYLLRSGLRVSGEAHTQ